jgi:hypothetical protein
MIACHGLQKVMQDFFKMQFGRARRKERGAGTPTPKFKFLEWTVALAEQSSSEQKPLQISVANCVDL